MRIGARHLGQLLRRLLRPLALELGRGAHREDLHHRLGHAQVGRRPAPQRHEQAHDAARRVEQRCPHVALDLHVREHPVLGEFLLHALRVGTEGLVRHGLARCAREGVFEVRHDLAAGAHGQGPDRIPSLLHLAGEGIIGLDALRQVTDERLEEVLALLRHDPLRQAAERLLGAPSLDHPSELDADLVHDHQDRLVRIDPLGVEELQNTRDFPSHEDREGEGRPQPQVMHQAIAREVGVLRDVRYPGGGPIRQNPSGQSHAPAEGEGLTDFAEGLEALGRIEVP